MERLSISIVHRSDIVYRVDYPRRHSGIKHRLRRLWLHNTWLVRDAISAHADPPHQLPPLT